MENNTWDIVPLPKGRKIFKCIWLDRTKYALYGSVERQKYYFPNGFPKPSN